MAIKKKTTTEVSAKATAADLHVKGLKSEIQTQPITDINLDAVLCIKHVDR